jgi:hypothetical protein
VSGRKFDLERITGAFAEAAVDPSKWDAAMETVAEATYSFGAALLPIRGLLPNMPFSRSITASTEAYVRDGWIQKDQRYRAVPAMIRNGVATEFDFTNAEEISKHPYYQEFLAPHRLRWFAAVKMASADDLWGVSRSIEQGPFSPSELAQLQSLSPQLSSAAAVARAMGFARVEAALDALQVSATAVVLLDRLGEVLR